MTYFLRYTLCSSDLVQPLTEHTHLILRRGRRPHIFYYYPDFTFRASCSFDMLSCSSGNFTIFCNYVTYFIRDVSIHSETSITVAYIS